ncbi:MAG: hypothetical protein V4590_09075 [Bacteroidota bacterium]
MKNNIILVLLLITCCLKMEAQIFLANDTVRNFPVVELGIGGTSGGHYYEPAQGQFIFNNVAGYNYGLLFRLKANVYKGFSIGTDYRYIKSSGTIDITDDVIRNFFYVQSTGMQIPIILQYTFRTKEKREVVSVFGAYTYNTFHHQTSSDYFESNQPFYASAIGAELVNGRRMDWTSYIFGLSKSFDFARSFSATIFFEMEGSSDYFQLNNSFTNKTTMGRESHSANFRSNSVRIGFLINTKL